MSKKDKVQAEINWAQLIFTLSIGTLFSTIGWFATSYSNIVPIIGILASIICVFLVIVVLYTKFFIKNKIDELEDL